jgi:hypothetical protein
MRIAATALGGRHRARPDSRRRRTATELTNIVVNSTLSEVIEAAIAVHSAVRSCASGPSTGRLWQPSPWSSGLDLQEAIERMARVFATVSRSAPPRR